MNGDSYSSRGMASATTLPRIRKHETDTNNPSAVDSGRYGSSRDHYVCRSSVIRLIAISLTVSRSPLETNAAMEVAIEILIEAATVDALGHHAIETLDHLGEISRLILTPRVEIIERGNEKIGILDETHEKIEHGIEIGVAEVIMVTEE